MDSARPTFILPPEYTGPVAFVVSPAPSVPSYIGGTIWASYVLVGAPSLNATATVRPGKKSS